MLEIWGRKKDMEIEKSGKNNSLVLKESQNNNNQTNEGGICKGC